MDTHGTVANNIKLDLEMFSDSMYYINIFGCYYYIYFMLVY